MTTDAKGGSFTFVPDESLPDGSDYALQIEQGAEENYTGLMTLGDGSKPPPPPPPPKPTEDVKPQNSSKPAPQDDASSRHDTNTANTAPKDGWDTEVAKGNNGQFASVGDVPKGSNSNFTHGKSAMAAKLETNGATIQNVYLGWVLATAGVLFYVAE